MNQQDETFAHLKHEHDNLDSSREVLSEGKKRGARDHTSNTPHNLIVKDDEYRKCIAFPERISNWFYSCFRCINHESSYVQKLQELQRRHTVSINEQMKKLLKDKIIKLKIVQTSRLELDSNVIHPFVKVHIINRNTGCYLQKKHEQIQPMVYHYEPITFYEDRKYDTSQCNIVLPFATNPCDFRKIGNSICKWNQRFFINFPADKILIPQALFLFQLLDFNHQALVYKDNNHYDKDNFYRIAWGYLRPVGLSKSHVGINKVELYRYKFNNKKMQHNLSKSYIPSVYYDYLWNNHQKYQGYLTVQLNYTVAPKYKLVQDEAEGPQSLFEQQPIDRTYLSRIGGGIMEKQIDSGIGHMNLLKYFRNNNICQIPRQLIYKLQSQRLGCFRVLFIGNYLYAACSTKKHTNIKVFSLERGEKVMTLKGHRQILYSMQATPNQKYLITAGSDRIVRIWEIPSQFRQYIDEQQSELLLRHQFFHAAAVYSTACIHVPLNDKLYIVTCCYDGFIRLWQVNLQNNSSEIIKQILITNYQKQRSNLLYKRIYPTACVVSQSNFFIVGDSIGDIRIFDFSHNNLNQRCHIANEELNNDEILNIKIINKNNILVQASDNLIRHFELSSNKLRMAQKFSGAQFDTQLCDFALSPDNRYILSPSQTGRPFMWDIMTGLQIPTDHLNLDIKGPLITCAWHPKYNLVAFGGFVQLCPIMVYGNILNDAQQKLVAAQLQ